MARKDQFCFDIVGLRSQVEGLRSDRVWRALSLAQKVRFVVEMGLQHEADLDLLRDFILAIANGESLEGFSLTELADVLEVDESDLGSLFCNVSNDRKNIPY